MRIYELRRTTNVHGRRAVRCFRLEDGEWEVVCFSFDSVSRNGESSFVLVEYLSSILGCWFGDVMCGVGGCEG